MKYRVMWRERESSIWHIAEFDDEEKAVEFYKGLDSTDKSFWIKRRIGYTRLDIIER